MIGITTYPTCNHTHIHTNEHYTYSFSYGVPVHNEAQVARDVYAFLLKLLRRYPQYQGLPLYVFGESCTCVAALAYMRACVCGI